MKCIVTYTFKRSSNQGLVDIEHGAMEYQLEEAQLTQAVFTRIRIAIRDKHGIHSIDNIDINQIVSFASIAEAENVVIKYRSRNGYIGYTDFHLKNGLTTIENLTKEVLTGLIHQTSITIIGIYIL